MSQRPEERIIAILNEAAGLQDGFDANGSRRGISCGYIGNCSMSPGGYDDRSWGFFRPHPKADQRMIGRYATHADLLTAYNADPTLFIDWAKESVT